MGSKSRKDRPPASTAPTPATRPSHSFDSSTRHQRRPRILSGLHPSQDVIGGIPLPWENRRPVATEPPPSTRYTTRGTLNGFQRGIYDDKYHPMDEVTRPTASAKREQRLKAQTLPSEDDGITLSSGSGSDAEDTDDDEEEGPIVPSRKTTSTQRSKRTRRSDTSKQPLYNMKKHPADDILRDSGDNITVNPRQTKRRSIRTSSGTMHADTPQGVTPEPATSVKEPTTPKTGKLGTAPQFPEQPPSSMQETIRRTMALVKEASLLMPLLPAIEAHLQKFQSPIQVYEDRGVVHRTNSRSALLYLGDFEKENIRATSPANNAVDSSLDDMALEVHSSGDDLHDQEYQETEYGLESRQPSEDIDQPRHGSSSHRTPPLRLPSLSPLPHSQTRAQRLQEPPSTGNTPHRSQVENDVPCSKALASPRTVITDGHDNGPQEQTVENDLMDFATEILEDPQSDTQSLQVTIPPSDEDDPQERTNKDTHLSVSQSDAYRDDSQIGTQVTTFVSFDEDASELGLQHSQEL